MVGKIIKHWQRKRVLTSQCADVRKERKCFNLRRQCLLPTLINLPPSYSTDISGKILDKTKKGEDRIGYWIGLDDWVGGKEPVPGTADCTSEQDAKSTFVLNSVRLSLILLKHMCLSFVYIWVMAGCCFCFIPFSPIIWLMIP